MSDHAGFHAANASTPSPKSLAQFPLLEGLLRNDMDALGSLVKEEHYPAGEYIMRTDERADCLFSLTSGIARIMVENHLGREVPLNFAGPGEILGEISLLDRKGRTASVVAEEDCIVLRLEGRDFEWFAMSSPRLSFNLAVALALRVRRATEHICLLAMENTHDRVCHALYRFTQEWGVPHPEGGILIRLCLPQEFLTGFVGATRESVSQTLAALERAGCVTFEPQDRIRAHDVEAMLQPRQQILHPD